MAKKHGKSNKKANKSKKKKGNSKPCQNQGLILSISVDR